MVNFLFRCCWFCANSNNCGESLNGTKYLIWSSQHYYVFEFIFISKHINWAAWSGLCNREWDGLITKSLHSWGIIWVNLLLTPPSSENPQITLGRCTRNSRSENSLFTGVPFLILGRKVFNCQHSIDRAAGEKRKRKDAEEVLYIIISFYPKVQIHLWMGHMTLISKYFYDICDNSLILAKLKIV